MVKNWNQKMWDGGHLEGKEEEKGKIRENGVEKAEEEEKGDAKDIARLKQEINQIEIMLKNTVQEQKKKEYVLKSKIYKISK